MGIRHTKVSVVPDVGSTVPVRPSDWNADHTISGDVDFNGFDALNLGNLPVNYYVNVKDFGAVGDGVTDDTTAIQDAIDYAANNEYGTVYMPSGFYKTTDSIWLDPPGNARSNFSNPPNSQFTLRLKGDGHGGGNFPGTVISCNHTGTGLYVGPGQHMGVDGVQIIGQNPGIGKFSQLSGSSGINILCAGGGAHVTNIVDCDVLYFTFAYSVGGNHDALGDSNNFIRCNAYNCYYGVRILGSQQFINAARDCVFTNVKIGFYSQYNVAIEVNGGNFSCDFGGYAVWDMDTVSAIGAVAAPGTNYLENSFSGALELQTMTVHLPGTGTGISGNPSFADWIVEQDRFAIITDHFGIVPFYKVDWNAGTHVLTLEFVGDWIATLIDSNPGYGAITSVWADLQTELQAATKLYAGVLTTMFRSAGIYVKDVHVENANTIVRLMKVVGGWQTSIGCKLENVYLNWDPGNVGDNDPAQARYALNVLTVVFPFIQQDNSTNLFVHNLRGPGGRVLVYADSGGGSFISRFTDVELSLNVKGPRMQNYPWDAHDRCIDSGGRGFGEFDRTPFYPGNNQVFNGNERRWFYHHGGARTPFAGYMPAPWVLPRLSTSQLDELSGTITFGADFDTFQDFTTGPVCGDCLYRIGNFESTAGAPTLVRFNHSAWTWGKDITTNWEHGAASPFLYMDTAGLKMMFAGLAIGLDYSGPTLAYYIVVAVHYQHGYVEIMPSSGFPYPGWFGGPAVSGSYTGTVIRQQAISIHRIGDVFAAALTDSHIAGKHFYLGDRIWQSAPSAGTSMGWVCTTAGIAGSGAVFKAMANLT